MDSNISQLIKAISPRLNKRVPLDMEDLDMNALVANFFELQQERAYAYRLLEEGHKIYLSTGPAYDFTSYREVVHVVTQDFKRISEGVLAIEQSLQRAGCPRIAQLLSDIQELERKKLNVTAKLQLAKQNIQDQDAPDTELKQLKRELGSIVEDINELLETIKIETE